METLADRIAREGPLTELDAVGWAIRLAKRIESMHALGVTHGSVSPQCVLVEGKDRAARASLVDVRRTPSSIGFHSPERVGGGGLSQADDTWALACTLYAALTGSTPFSGSSDADIKQKILASAPAPLAVFDVGDDDLQRVLDDAFARDLASRTVTVGALRRALEEWHPDPNVSGLPGLEDEDTEGGAEDDEEDEDERTIMRPAPILLAKAMPAAAPPADASEASPVVAAPPSATAGRVPAPAAPPPRASSPGAIPAPRASSPGAIPAPRASSAGAIPAPRASGPGAIPAPRASASGALPGLSPLAAPRTGPAARVVPSPGGARPGAPLRAAPGATGALPRAPAPGPLPPPVAPPARPHDPPLAPPGTPPHDDEDDEDAEDEKTVMRTVPEALAALPPRPPEASRSGAFAAVAPTKSGAFPTLAGAPSSVDDDEPEDEEEATRMLDSSALLAHGALPGDDEDEEQKTVMRASPTPAEVARFQAAAPPPEAAPPPATAPEAANEPTTPRSDALAEPLAGGAGEPEAALGATMTLDQLNLAPAPADAAPADAAPADAAPAGALSAEAPSPLRDAPDPTAAAPEAAAPQAPIAAPAAPGAAPLVATGGPTLAAPAPRSRAGLWIALVVVLLVLAGATFAFLRLR